MSRVMDYTKTVEAVIAIVSKDYSVVHSLEHLAVLVRKSELELQTAFKAVHGKTVMQYLRELRMQYAHAVLEQHDYPLRVVCEMVGYPDPSNFSVAFLAQYGYRPGMVRRNKK